RATLGRGSRGNDPATHRGAPATDARRSRARQQQVGPHQVNSINPAPIRNLPSPRGRWRPFHVLMLVALVVLLAGCAARQTRPTTFQPFHSYSEEMQRAAASGQATAGNATPAPAADTNGTQDLNRVGSGSFINESAAQRVPPGPGPTGEVSFNFEGESLHAVVKAILGDFLQ